MVEWQDGGWLGAPHRVREIARGSEMIGRDSAARLLARRAGDAARSSGEGKIRLAAEALLDRLARGEAMRRATSNGVDQTEGVAEEVIGLLVGAAG